MFDNFSKESKIWIFQSNRNINDIEITEIYDAWSIFAKNWNAHGFELESKMNIAYNNFIIICLDETKSQISGCAIDKLTHFIQSIEKKINLNLLDRTTVSFKKDNLIEKSTLKNLKDDYASGKINDETLVFNNLVKSLNEFESNWIVPLKNSWHTSFLN